MDIEDFKLINGLAALSHAQGVAIAAVARAMAAFLEQDAARRDVLRGLAKHPNAPEIQRIKDELQAAEATIDAQQRENAASLKDQASQIETQHERLEAVLASAKARLGF